VAAAQRGLPGSRYFVYRKNGRRGSGDEKRVLRPGTSDDGISSIFLLRHLRLWDAAWVCLFRCGCMVREKIFGGAEKAGSDSFVCPDLCGYSVQIQLYDCADGYGSFFYSGSGVPKKAVSASGHRRCAVRVPAQPQPSAGGAFPGGGSFGGGRPSHAHLGGDGASGGQQSPGLV